jgi:hypothetical protein
MTLRQAKQTFSKAQLFLEYLEAALKLDEQGIQPTGRKLVAIVRGGSPKDYPQGIGNNDKLAYDNAMLALGYEKGKHTNGMWKRFPPSLDEVLCNDTHCPFESVNHVMSEHRA